jgi:hypothetical protein
MTTIRTPIRRPPFVRFSDEMLDIFIAMKECNCTCPPTDWGGAYWEAVTNRCAGCEAWWDLHARLFHLWPGVRPWFWPIVESPNVRCPFPDGSESAKAWRPDEEAQARWRDIEAAVAERERMRGAAEPPAA